MLLALLIFANSRPLGNGWPDKEGFNHIFCIRHCRDPNNSWFDRECEHARDVAKILIRVSAGVAVHIA